jgi:hypothetical protein
MGAEIVRISSHWNVWEADWARSRLAAEDIQAHLGNAALVSWVWYYGNAVGGVTVHVSAPDAEAARGLLAFARDEATESPRSWACSTCGARGYPSWDVCWNCGASVEGVPGPASGHDEATPLEAPTGARKVRSGLLGALAAMVLLAVFLAGGIVAFLAAASFVALAVLVILGWDSAAASEPTWDEVSEPSRASLGAPPAKQPRMRNSIVERAWRASVLGFCAFPPLSLYTLWLLWRVLFRGTRLGRSDRVRCILALILGVLAIPVMLVMGLAILFAGH